MAIIAECLYFVYCEEIIFFMKLQKNGEKKARVGIGAFFYFFLAISWETWVNIFPKIELFLFF